MEVAEDKQATNILLLDISKASNFADYFVIMTAESRRQIDSLSEELAVALKRSGASFHHREGSTTSGWLLLDFGEVIVHLFAPEERDYYCLEGRWADAHQILRIQ